MHTKPCIHESEQALLLFYLNMLKWNLKFLKNFVGTYIFLNSQNNIILLMFTQMQFWNNKSDLCSNTF